MAQTFGSPSMDLGTVKMRTPAIVAVLGPDAASKAVEAKRLGADVLEVRLDLIAGEPVEEMARVREISALPLIATNRLRGEGGGFSGGEEERIEVLREASKFADMVDVELRSPSLEEVVSSFKRPLLISFHDFQGMPDRAELMSILGEMAAFGAHISKVAVTPSTFNDTLELLKVLLEAPGALCVIGIGEIGRHLRAVAPIYGSVLSYGYLSEAVAPGQMHVSDLQEAFRIMGLRP